jgi:ubiquinone biosynthesis protein
MVAGPHNQSHFSFLVRFAPLPAKAIANVIQEDLGGPPDKLFAFFDVKPLGSASIGQVHAALLSDGRDVVLKVRKPGVDELVRIDLEILEGLVEEWTPRFPVLQQYDARGLARDFSDALLAARLCKALQLPLRMCSTDGNSTVE